MPSCCTGRHADDRNRIDTLTSQRGHDFRGLHFAPQSPRNGNFGRQAGKIQRDGYLAIPMTCVLRHFNDLFDRDILFNEHLHGLLQGILIEHRRREFGIGLRGTFRRRDQKWQ